MTYGHIISCLKRFLFSDIENQYDKFKKVEDNFNALQSALKEIQSDNHEKVIHSPLVLVAKLLYTSECSSV